MTNIKNTEQTTEISASEVKIAGRKEMLEELMEKGFLSFNKSYIADLFMNAYQGKCVLKKTPSGEYRVYSTNEDLVSLNSFINEYALVYMCGLTDLFSDYNPLSFVFNANKDETFSYTLIGRNPIDNTETIITRGEVNYSTEFQIKALPSLLIELRKYNNTLLVIEDGEEFNVDTAPDKERSYVVFKNLSYEQKKVIYEVKDFANKFVDSTKVKSKNDLSAIYTWEKQSLGMDSFNELDKENAEDIIKNYTKYANELNCPFYVTVAKNNDGTCNFKLQCIDEEINEVVTLVDKNINFYGEFRTKVLPILHADLEVNGGVGKVALYNNNLSQPIDYKKFGNSSVMFFVGFSKLEMEYIQDGLKNIKYKPKPRPKVKPKPKPKTETEPTTEEVTEKVEPKQEGVESAVPEEVAVDTEIGKEETPADRQQVEETPKEEQHDDLSKKEPVKQVSSNDDYNKMISDKVSKFGYLKLSSKEFKEFTQKSQYIDWNTNIVDDSVFVYPSIKILNEFDKNINATIFTTIRDAIQADDGKISVFVNRLNDGSCMVDIKSFDSKTNSTVNLSSVRVIFEGDFLQNILPFIHNSLPILGPVVYKEFSVINLGDEIPAYMVKDKNVVMFNGLTTEMSQQLHKAIEFEDMPHFGLN